MSIASVLVKHSSQAACFVCPSSKVLDFTSRAGASPRGVVLTSSLGSDFVALEDEWSTRMFHNAARMTLMDGGKRFLAWDWKSVAAFVLGRHGIRVPMNSPLVDLKLVESVTATRLECPRSVGEFGTRLKSVLTSDGWGRFQEVYRKVYVPLSASVVPAMEAAGVLCEDRIHAHYDIAGQDNGRMLCHKAFERGYNPHSLGADEKSLFKPLALDHVFLSFDFSGMEVMMLAWLSGDKALSSMCESGDMYRSVYEEITKTSCDSDEKRSMCKSFLLPLFYGMGFKAMSERLGLPEEVCAKLGARVRSSFQEAWGFVERAQCEAESCGYVVDRFGKVRSLPDRHYRARNFAVQSPASVFCMAALIRLFESLNGLGQILYNVHDGYVASVPRDRVRDALLAGRDALESECDLFPGLSIRVSCSAGRRLSEMRSLSVPRNKA